MLVLSRKKYESIRIGDGIYVTIVEVDRGKVRLGIECDKSISIMRTELLDDSELPPKLRQDQTIKE